MIHRLSRRGFGKVCLSVGAAASGGAAIAQTTRDSLTRKLPPVLRPLMTQVPLEVVGIVDGIRQLERDAERLKLPESILSPKRITSLPLDPDRLYEAALPRLVALVDRAEFSNRPFSDRAGALLARLHSTQRIIPEGLAGPALGRAGPARRALLLAMAEPPGLPGRAGGQSAQLALALPAAEVETPMLSLPEVSRSLRFADLRDEYAAFFEDARLRPEHGESAEFHLAMIRKAKPRYLAVGKRAKVPWVFIAVIHALEASFNFRAHLHNGDFPLDQRTRQVPSGRPSVWLPPSDWDSSAMDALRLLGFTDQEDWSMPRMLHRLEAYNGFGYRRRGLASAYLWSFSNHYDRGKFVADGRFDPRARSQQCGAATMLRILADADELHT